jgi:hypothetical protein
MFRSRHRTAGQPGKRVRNPAPQAGGNVMKTRTYSERAEIEFELDYPALLTTRSRSEMMVRKSPERAPLRKRC